MHKVKDLLWVWHGGKWIVFDSKEKIEALARGVEPLIDSGEINSAKYWNKDPSAINVYSFDSDKERVWEILKDLGAGESRVWEYDYAMDKNIMRPFDFLYSWLSKFRTILQSYGLTGTLRLIKEMLNPRV